MACCSPRSHSSSSTVPNVPPERFAITGLAQHADKLLALDCPDRAVNVNFHVTEIKLADITSLDCGNRSTRWQEIIVQIMDMADSADEPLTIRKVTAIFEKSLQGRAIDADAKYTIELSDGSDAIRLYDVIGSRTAADAFHLVLAPRTSVCKATQRWSALGTTSTGCCSAASA